MAERNLILTKESTQNEIKSYFSAILELSKSDNEFPINLDEVWMLVYTEKGKAVRTLKENFIEGIDYRTFAQNGKTETGGYRVIDYHLTVSCLEFFIARKVRPVFEVYRQVFHQAVKNPFSVPQSLSEALMLAAKQAEQLEVAQKQIEQKDRTIQANAPRVRFSHRKIFSQMFACCKNMPNFALEHHNKIIILGKESNLFFTKIKETHYGGGMETALSHTRPAYVVMFTPTVGFSLLLNSIRFEHE